VLSNKFHQLANDQFAGLQKLSNMLRLAILFHVYGHKSAIFFQQKLSNQASSFQVFDLNYKFILGVSNFFMFFSFTSEFCLVMMIMYIKPLNYVLGARDLNFRHAGTCGLCITTLLIFWNETRKYFVNSLIFY
jgi:hypothetical protein